MTELTSPVQALCDRLGAVRWLRPDAEMDTLAEASLRWIDERVDEHKSAISTWLQGPAPSLAVTLTRSLREARVLSGHARSQSEFKDFSVEAMRWVSALEAQSRHATVDAARALGSVAVAEMQTQMWAHLRALSGAVDLPTKNEVGLVTEIAVGVPGGEAMVAHAMVLLNPSAKPSPWAPLLAMWERGLCPLPALDGGMVVYVPVRRGDRLVLDPTPGSEAREPAAHLFSGGIHPPGMMRPTEPTPEGNARVTLKRFNRMGLGPLVGMYEPPNMAFPGYTNWPGPPDLYIVRPPERPVTATDVTALMNMPGMPPPSFMPTPNLPATGEPFGRPVPWYRKIFRGQ